MRAVNTTVIDRSSGSMKFRALAMAMNTSSFTRAGTPCNATAVASCDSRNSLQAAVLLCYIALFLCRTLAEGRSTIIDCMLCFILVGMHDMYDIKDTT